VKPPASLLLVTIAGTVLGAALAWAGLMQRLFPATPSPFGPWGLWSGEGVRLLIDAQPLAWPMIAVGCAWLGVVIGLWLRLGWVRRVGFALAAVTAIGLGLALPLAIVALAGLLASSLKLWLAPEGPADGR
jgi:hypothetical protein